MRPIEDDYRWLARIYASIRPSVDANALLWHRLGTKTRDLIGEYISGVKVEESVHARKGPRMPSSHHR